MNGADEVGVRLEIIDDIPVWEPSPGIRHQSFAERILSSIEPIDRQAARDGGCGCWAFADIAIEFPDGSIKRPDLSVFCREPDEPEGVVAVTPEAVVEIVSPGYEKRDTVLGVPFYQRMGVADIVLVFPGSRSVEHHRGDQTWRLQAPVTVELLCGCRLRVPDRVNMPRWRWSDEESS